MSRSLVASGLLVVSLLPVALVHAQGNPSGSEAPPRGPADIVKRTVEARDARDKAVLQAPVSQGEAATGDPSAPADALPAGHPQLDDTAQPSAAGGMDDTLVGDDPHAHAPGAPPLARRALSTADPSPDLGPGKVRVRVLDENEHPVAADLSLGTMAQQAGRTSQSARTGADGTHVFDNLPTGDKQAYRVNVLYQGAKYSSTPFRLPTDRGFDVLIRRLPTTRDSHDLVLYVGATSLELKDERIKVVQQARLINIGSKTYVFPEGGQLVPLPKDLLVFQAEEIMTDQHLKEEKGQGVRLTGSVPPGEVTLTWGFDVPRESSTAEFSFDLPWVTFAYRVLADAAPGMTLEVDGMPAAELHEDNGRRFYVTEIMKRVGEQPLRRVHIRLKNIPGPGPMRFIAVGLALLVVGIGVFISRKHVPGSNRLAPDQNLAAQKSALLQRAAALDDEHERGEIGPEFHAQARQELEDELAAVLYEQSRMQSGKPPTASV
jgi:hypothetical protein